MRSALAATAILAVLFYSPESRAATSKAGIFSVLSVGDTISVKEVGQKYDLTKIPGAIAPYKVTAIESDYIELKMGTMIIRIPATSIRMLGVTSTSGDK